MAARKTHSLAFSLATATDDEDSQAALGRRVADYGFAHSTLPVSRS